MTKALAVVVAVVVAVAAYAVTATAGQQAVTPKQFKALSSKVTNVQKKLTSLQKELRGLEGCITQAVAVGQYGDGDNGTFGYSYHNSSGQDFYTTALDLADPSSATSFMLLTDAQCASIFNGGSKHAKLVVPHLDHIR
jgi:opacity protein-like surface antigen